MDANQLKQMNPQVHRTKKARSIVIQDLQVKRILIIDVNTAVDHAVVPEVVVVGIAVVAENATEAESMMTESVVQKDIQMVKDVKKMENVSQVIPINQLNKYTLIHQHHSKSIAQKRRNARIMIMKVCSFNIK